MGVTERWIVDASTNWKPKKDTRVRPQTQVTSDSENLVFPTDSIQDDELFEEARQEFINNWSKK